MNINSDINFLGGLADWHLVTAFIGNDQKKASFNPVASADFTVIKTDKSIRRYAKAIHNTLLHFSNKDMEALCRQLIRAKGIDSETLLVLFWNTAFNNQLFHYLNEKVFFPAFYSGRSGIKRDEVVACMDDLKQTQPVLREWSASTLLTTASKYLSLLKKFGLMEGSLTKTICYPYLSDEMFIIFIYWLVAASSMPNLLKSEWLVYGFTEIQPFIDRLMQKKYAIFFHITYTGNRLEIETQINYQNLYETLQ